MAEKWYDDLPDDAFVTETDIAYKEAVKKIREGLEKGLDFDSACAAIQAGDEKLKQHIIDDMLKVLVAEEHYNKNIPLDKLSEALNVSVDRLETAKREMLEDVKESSIKAFYKGLKPGNA
jgi:hypothetical protein